MNKTASHGFLFSFVLVTAFIDIGVKIVMKWLPPITVAAFVSSIGATGSLGVYLCRVHLFKTYKRIRFDHSTYVKLFLMSVCAGAALISSNSAIDIIDPLTFRVIQIIFFPLFVALIARVFDGTSMTKKETISTIIGVFGFFVYFFTDLAHLSFIFTGVLLSILAAFLYAIVLVFTKHLASLRVPNGILIAYRFLLLGMCSLFFTRQGTFVVLPKVAFLVIGLGIVGYWLRYELMVEGIKNLPVMAMSLYTVSIPVFSAILNRIFLRTAPYHIMQIVGLVLVVIALLYSVSNLPAGFYSWWENATSRLIILIKKAKIKEP